MVRSKRNKIYIKEESNSDENIKKVFRYSQGYSYINLGGDSARQDKQILQRNTSSQSTSYVKNTERHTESLFITLKVMKKWK